MKLWIFTDNQAAIQPTPDIVPPRPRPNDSDNCCLNLTAIGQARTQPMGSMGTRAHCSGRQRKSRWPGKGSSPQEAPEFYSHPYNVLSQTSCESGNGAGVAAHLGITPQRDELHRTLQEEARSILLHRQPKARICYHSVTNGAWVL
jgi:hypothetical protein